MWSWLLITFPLLTESHHLLPFFYACSTCGFINIKVLPGCKVHGWKSSRGLLARVRQTHFVQFQGKMLWSLEPFLSDLRTKWFWQILMNTPQISEYSWSHLLLVMYAFLTAQNPGLNIGRHCIVMSISKLVTDEESNLKLNNSNKFYSAQSPKWDRWLKVIKSGTDCS